MVCVFLVTRESTPARWGAVPGFGSGLLRRDVPPRGEAFPQGPMLPPWTEHAAVRRAREIHLAHFLPDVFFTIEKK